QVATEKIKNSTEAVALELVANPDILAEVGALETRPFLVGFAAETGDLEANARAKLERKRLDLVTANRVGADAGFEREDNALLLLWPGGEEDLGHDDKARLARRLVARIAERYRAERA